MHLIGVDDHPSFRQIAFLDQETGECGDRRLNHSDGEAEKFYRELRAKGGVSVCVRLEATGYSRWFERLLGELGIEVWIGNAAEIKAKRRVAFWGYPARVFNHFTPEKCLPRIRHDICLIRFRKRSAAKTLTWAEIVPKRFSPVPPGSNCPPTRTELSTL